MASSLLHTVIGNEYTGTERRHMGGHEREKEKQKEVDECLRQKE